jgi:hypothetical protein
MIQIVADKAHHLISGPVRHGGVSALLFQICMRMIVLRPTQNPSACDRDFRPAGLNSFDGSTAVEHNVAIVHTEVRGRRRRKIFTSP